mmetsp:Transcript_29682/g.28873  ORF Transcript_29682/g.28873 Transcript_29682/m.28873 type:complete len:94 (-) Transcript_29682:74-355(-)|eukprot:CAMPEP_0170565842 /NCGR_PEP_ID=MMETSP0211-20121228/79445_1 /TAXON_ID=311385 /ORGANISM="Pseudokeronopsis sp., Strain OXSARD2" /LENGTH=93 /DNA_ID=CAMNT_0010886823 /DNA_START=583 /DNA_END=864 /DNA_ORIENTATION=-
MKYGIYYRGFKDEYFYWDILVVNIKRILYVLLTLTLLESNKHIFILSIFSIMYLYMWSVKVFKPYQSDSLNNLDQYSALTTSMTLVFSLVYIK